MNKEQELRAALTIARAYVEQAVKDDGGIDNCEIGDRLAIERIDAALARRSSDEQAEVVAWMVVDWDKAYGPAGMRYLTRSEAEDNPDDWEPGEYEAFKQAMRSAIPLYRAPPAVAAGGVTATWHPLDAEGYAELRVNGARITTFASYPAAEEAADRINKALAVGDEGIREGVTGTGSVDVLRELAREEVALGYADHAKWLRYAANRLSSFDALRIAAALAGSTPPSRGEGE